MSSLYAPYVPIVVMLVVVVGMGLAMLIVNEVLGPRRKSARKQQAFECGNAPIAKPRQRYDVKFYLVALFFIVFDIEVVFLFPWAVRFKEALAQGNGWLYMGEMFIFLGLLTVGLVYVWKRGALRWE